MCEITDHPVDGKTRAAGILRSTADGGDDQARVAFAYLLNRGIGLERNAELAADTSWQLRKMEMRRRSFTLG